MSELKGNDYLGSGKDNWTVHIYTDGTVTEVAVLDQDDVMVGKGIARRRKGDRRDEEFGMALAASRAFQAVADTFADMVKEMQG